MNEPMVTIRVPRLLYERVERLASVGQRSPEQVVAQTLDRDLPTLPDTLPQDVQEELASLETLDDDSLWQVAREMISSEQAEQLRELSEKQQFGELSAAEARTLAQLRDEADLRMLRKAYASVLLKWRGHRLPTLAELEAYEE